MDRVSRKDDILRDIKKLELEVLDSFVIGNEDALILCAGFEDRALAVLEQQTMSGNADFTVLVIQYRPYIEENKYTEISLERAKALNNEK